MAALRRSTPESIYQLKVTLKTIKPPIWRRILVPSDVTLHKLHNILQVVMGWEDCHLHQFKVQGVNYGEPDPDFGLDIHSDRRARLAQIAPEVRSRFAYEYDFGDGWDHQIVVEKILPPVPGAHYPTCLAGQRACPPEDCGGVPGYYQFVEAMQNPDHPEHRAMRDWFGAPYDPEAFDLEGVIEALESTR